MLRTSRSRTIFVLSGLTSLRTIVIVFFPVAMQLASMIHAAAAAPPADDDGTLHMPSYTLPESSLLGADVRAALKNIREDNSAAYRHLREQYRVVITAGEIGGVHTETFVPTDGIARQNEGRVLINLHGGGFSGGGTLFSYLESVPIASVGKIKVISIDYRLAPEWTFPAASEDVAAVYRVLLRTYKPENIGLYGFSAGGLLTAEAIAWFQKEYLPLPGAVGMFSGGASYWMEGDSAYIFGTRLYGNSKDTIQENPYFKGASANDPFVLPTRSPELLRKFPPSLLITGTRDFALSSVVFTHSLLVAQQVDAELHVWEGLGHGFFLTPDLPQSREAYSVIVNFFDSRLGR